MLNFSKNMLFVFSVVPLVLMAQRPRVQIVHHVQKIHFLQRLGEFITFVFTDRGI